MMELKDLGELLEAQIKGNPFLKIIRVSSYADNSNNSISYVEKKIDIKKFFLDQKAYLISSDLVDIFPENANLLIVDNVRFSFAKLTSIYKKHIPNLYPSVNLSVAENSSYGDNCLFGNNVTIEDNVSIGNNVLIGHNVTISQGVIIGNCVSIGPGTNIGTEGFGNVLIKDKWTHIHHLGSVIIKDNVSIGSNCTIDRGTIDNTVINQGVILDNQIHIAHNVIIGENTAIAANTGIAGSCNIGKRNMIGGMVGIVDHIKTADDVIISATSTVNKEIKEPGTYTGFMPIVKHSRWKRIALWIAKLDKIAKSLNLKKSKL